MNFNLDEVMRTFIEEAQELLQSMEESLLLLENDPQDSDNIGAVFRAAHTIKGSAGLFGLSPIVSFTHILEDVLDSVRNGALIIDNQLVALLFVIVLNVDRVLSVEEMAMLSEVGSGAGETSD